MKWKWLLIGLASLLVLGVVILSLQNQAGVMLEFLGWRFGPLALSVLLLSAFALGMLSAILVALPSRLHLMHTKRQLSHDLAHSDTLITTSMQQPAVVAEPRAPIAPLDPDGIPDLDPPAERL